MSLKILFCLFSWVCGLIHCPEKKTRRNSIIYIIYECLIKIVFFKSAIEFTSKEINRQLPQFGTLFIIFRGEGSSMDQLRCLEDLVFFLLKFDLDQAKSAQSKIDTKICVLSGPAKLKCLKDVHLKKMEIFTGSAKKHIFFDKRMTGIMKKRRRKIK